MVFGSTPLCREGALGGPAQVESRSGVRTVAQPTEASPYRLERGMAKRTKRPSGTVTIKWSGVFTDVWETNPQRPTWDLEVDPGMARDQLVRLLRAVADDTEAD
jgi:uncharacterized protein YbjT (DUF2867 family)